MGFLTPLLLTLGVAVAVPLVLHLIQRQHGPRVVFPALRYLRRAEKENARRIKLRQLLLLALRVAAIALLALAAARPFLTWGGTEHRPTAAAIILDNSLSTGVVTGERRVLDVLKARALETLARAGPDDRFWLIRAATPWEPAVPTDAAATAERVRDTDVAAGAADLGSAVQRARALLAAGAGERSPEIHLLSDLQATSFRDAPPADADAPPILAWAPDEAAPANAAVSAVEIGGGLPPLADVRSTVTADLTGGAASAESTSVRLVLDGRVNSVATSPVAATTVLPFPARASGLVRGWVEIDPDALRGDDRRYFTVRVQPPPNVALAQPRPFLDDALTVLADAGRIRRAEPGAADIVVAPGAAGAGAVRSGRAVVVIPPATALELPAANQRLAAAGLPWRFAASEQSGEARFALDDDADPLLNTLDEAQLRETYRLVRDDAAGAGADSVLLRLRDGAPWAVRGELPDGGGYVVLGSPLSAEASTLPTTSALLPLMDRVIGAWVTDSPKQTEAVPGERIALPAGADAVQRPDGVRDTVQGGAYRAPAQPGLYRIYGDGRLAGGFAVNPPASESELERLDPADLTTALPGGTLALAGDSAEWAGTVFRERLGREAWRPFILLALAVLLIEGLIATAGGARTGGASSEPDSRRSRQDRRPGRPRPRTPAAAGEGA